MHRRSLRFAWPAANGRSATLHNVSYAPINGERVSWREPPRHSALRVPLILLVVSLLSPPAIRARGGGAPPVWGYLDNGMGYVLLESHAAPLIGSSVIVHCGSSREDFATSGASHFLEHLLFNGTETRTQEQLYADVDEIGGYNNATTARTHVVYMMVTPAENFHRGLEIQKDMLFHSTLPPEKVEKERGIILEELSRDQDTGSFDSDRLLDLAAFGPRGGGLPVLGSPQSIRTLSRDTIASFYHSLYCPQNMTLVVIGDFNSREMEKDVREVFGGEPAGPTPPETLAEDPAWDASPIVDSYDGTSVFLEWTWPGPAPREAGFMPFECVTALMSGDDSAPLNRYLRSEFAGKIHSSGGRVETLPHRSYFRFRVEADSSADWRAIADALPALLDRARTRPDSRAIDAWKTSEESQEYYLRERPHYYGVIEGERIATEGIDGVLTRPGRLERLSSADISNAVRTWATQGYRLAVLLPRPEGHGDSTRGTPSQGVRTTLPNGLDLLVLSSPESPVLALHLFVKGRSQAEPPDMDGAVELLHRLLAVRTSRLGPAAMTERLRSIGAELTTADNPDIPYDDFYSVPDYSFVKLQTLDRYAPEAFSLLQEMLSTPGWTDRDFEDARTAMLAQAEKAAVGSSSSGRQLLRGVLWAGTARGRAVFGTPSSLKAMSPVVLRDLSKRYFVGRRMLLVVATSTSPDQIMRLAESSVGKLPTGVSPPAREPRSGVARAIRNALSRSDAVPSEMDDLAVPDSTVLRVGKVGARQASVLWALTMGTIPPSEKAVADVWNAALSSKIQFQLREREGLAYSIGSGVDCLDDGTVLWTASAGTGAKNLPRVLAGFQEILGAALAEAPDTTEIRKQGAQLYGSTLRRRASRMNRAYATGLAIIEGRDPTKIDEDLRAPIGVNREDIITFISRLRRGPGTIVIAY